MNSPTAIDVRDVLREVRKLIDPYLSSQPANTKYRVPLSVSTFGSGEILDALHSLLIGAVTKGEKVSRFEEQFAAYLGVRHAIMVNSGSSANLLMMAVATNPMFSGRLWPGDEVLVPAVTWSTTLWPVVNHGLIPVLVDADIKTLNMSVRAAEEAIGPKTKAILVAHILGNAADMSGFQHLAAKHNLLLLEDTCESLGTKYRNAYAGTFGAAGTFSFYFSHHITTIEGGMVVTNDDTFADLCRCLRAHGWVRDMHAKDELSARHPDIDPRYLFVNVGYNLRPMEVQAAFGLHQLTKLPTFNTHRQTIALRMWQELSDLQKFLCPAQAEPEVKHTWFGFPVLLSPEHEHRRSEFIAHLESSGIETRPIVAGNLAIQPALKLFSHRVSGVLPNAQEVMRRGVYWGIHPYMTDEDVRHVVASVRSFFVG